MNIIRYIQGFFKILAGEKILKLSLEENSKFTVKTILNKEKINENIKKIKIKVKNGEKIKVAFLMMYSSAIQDLGLFELMLKSNIFQPYLIINPDVLRSQENMISTYKHTKDEIIKKYGENNVLDGYIIDTGHFNDYSDNFDMMITNMPYDLMAHDFFKIKYWAGKSIPIIYISYFYMGRCHVTVSNLKSAEFSLFWKFFAENNFVKKLSEKFQIIKGTNVVVTGYPKFDEFNKIEKKQRERKRVIIAPHHTIFNSSIDVGGFLEYYDLLLELPQKYPNIDFVFRPHPLLIQNLKKPSFWGETKTELYLSKLLSSPNITYSTEGNYYDLFVNSDALIHDCGSFMAEYLCTGHPCAYYMRSSVNMSKAWTKFGRQCLDLHYKLKHKSDFYKFLDDVVIRGNDTKKEERNTFAQKEILINYPNVTKTIFEYLQNELEIRVEG